MTTDAKGYMVTEDYSEYESVDEEEPEEPKPKAKKPGREEQKGRGSGKETYKDDH
ncbi:hypothetical protein QCA50_000069 [Cerrena zonata]|uniref:Uncharacterized protein n=1 Tax=Cerrena zonata TaxID=2478898 RepID=A0AAW0GX89_9APHY